MVRRNGAWRLRQAAARMFDEIMGAAIVSHYGKPPGWDVEALRHDVQVMADVDALLYCAVEVVHEEKIAIICWPFMGGGLVSAAEETQRPALGPSSGELRFVVYLCKDMAPFCDRLANGWDLCPHRPGKRAVGWVEIMPSRGALGKIGLSDGRSAALLPQDCRGLRRGDHVDCLVAGAAGTDALTAFLVTKVDITTPGATEWVWGWAPRRRTGEAPAGVMVDGRVLSHRAGPEGCPACGELARKRLFTSVTAIVRTLPAKITIGLVTSLIVSLLSSLVLVLVK
jgi:hypothetical protein